MQHLAIAMTSSNDPHFSIHKCNPAAGTLLHIVMYDLCLILWSSAQKMGSSMTSLISKVPKNVWNNKQGAKNIGSNNQRNAYLNKYGTDKSIPIAT